MILICYDSYERHVSILDKTTCKQQIKEITNLAEYINNDITPNDFEQADLKLWMYYLPNLYTLLYLLCEKEGSYPLDNYRNYNPPEFTRHGLYGRLYKQSCRLELLKLNYDFYKNVFPRLAENMDKLPTKPFSMYPINKYQEKINKQWIKSCNFSELKNIPKNLSMLRS